MGRFSFIADRSPVAVCNWAGGYTKQTVVPLDGSGSYAPAGGALHHRWDVVSKPASSSAAVLFPDLTSPLVRFVADVPGPYVISLTVSTLSRTGDPLLIPIYAGSTVVPWGSAQLPEMHHLWDNMKSGWAKVPGRGVYAAAWRAIMLAATKTMGEMLETDSLRSIKLVSQNVQRRWVAIPFIEELTGSVHFRRRTDGTGAVRPFHTYAIGESTATEIVLVVTENDISLAIGARTMVNNVPVVYAGLDGSDRPTFTPTLSLPVTPPVHTVVAASPSSYTGTMCNLAAVTGATFDVGQPILVTHASGILFARVGMPVLATDTHIILDRFVSVVPTTLHVYPLTSLVRLEVGQGRVLHTTSFPSYVKSGPIAVGTQVTTVQQVTETSEGYEVLLSDTVAIGPAEFSLSSWIEAGSFLLDAGATVAIHIETNGIGYDESGTVIAAIPSTLMFDPDYNWHDAAIAFGITGTPAPYIDDAEVFNGFLTSPELDGVLEDSVSTWFIGGGIYSCSSVTVYPERAALATGIMSIPALKEHPNSPVVYEEGRDYLLIHRTYTIELIPEEACSGKLYGVAPMVEVGDTISIGDVEATILAVSGAYVVLNKAHAVTSRTSCVLTKWRGAHIYLGQPPVAENMLAPVVIHDFTDELAAVFGKLVKYSKDDYADAGIRATYLDTITALMYAQTISRSVEVLRVAVAALCGLPVVTQANTVINRETHGITSDANGRRVSAVHVTAPDSERAKQLLFTEGEEWDTKSGLIDISKELDEDYNAVSAGTILAKGVEILDRVSWPGWWETLGVDEVLKYHTYIIKVNHGACGIDIATLAAHLKKTTQLAHARVIYILQQRCHDVLDVRDALSYKTRYPIYSHPGGTFDPTIIIGVRPSTEFVRGGGILGLVTTLSAPIGQPPAGTIDAVIGLASVFRSSMGGFRGESTTVTMEAEYIGATALPYIEAGDILIVHTPGDQKGQYDITAVTADDTITIALMAGLPPLDIPVPSLPVTDVSGLRFSVMRALEHTTTGYKFELVGYVGGTTDLTELKLVATSKGIFTTGVTRGMFLVDANRNQYLIRDIWDAGGGVYHMEVKGAPSVYPNFEIEDPWRTPPDGPTATASALVNLAAGTTEIRLSTPAGYYPSTIDLAQTLGFGAPVVKGTVVGEKVPYMMDTLLQVGDVVDIDGHEHLLVHQKDPSTLVVYPQLPATVVAPVDIVVRTHRSAYMDDVRRVIPKDRTFFRIRSDIFQVERTNAYTLTCSNKLSTISSSQSGLKGVFIVLYTTDPLAHVDVGYGRGVFPVVSYDNTGAAAVFTLADSFFPVAWAPATWYKFELSWLRGRYD